MLNIGIALLFIIITFGPRLVTFLNGGYGFYDLGLYSQFFSLVGDQTLNPIIPSLQKHFFEIKSEPFLFLLIPFKYFISPPLLFLILDQISILGAAFICFKFVNQRLQNIWISTAIFFCILFSSYTLDSLHSAARVALWLQLPLALLITEYYSSRRSRQMTAYFAAACFISLQSAFLALVLVPLIIFTQYHRWNLSRRLATALPIAAVAAISIFLIHLSGKSPTLDFNFLTEIQGSTLFAFLLTFGFLPILTFDSFLMALILLVIRFQGDAHDVVVTVPMMAVGSAVALEILASKSEEAKIAMAAYLVGITFVLNSLLTDPWFRVWHRERWALNPEMSLTRDLLEKIPQENSVLASSRPSVDLWNHPKMLVMGIYNGPRVFPDYLVVQNETIPVGFEAYYRFFAANNPTGTRLFVRIK